MAPQLKPWETTMLLYQAYAAGQSALEPMRWFADQVRTAKGHDVFGKTAMSANPMFETFAAACDVFADAKPLHDRPDWNIRTTVVNGQLVPVDENVVVDLPFCKLLNFQKQGQENQPTVLLIAPMSGHYATLLRGTVESLLPNHNVYITDWQNAREVPMWQGDFGLDDFIDYTIGFLKHLGPDTHAIAVCQPAVPLMVAVALMAMDQDPAQPRSMVLMGGPIDTRVSPTKINEFAQRYPLEAIKQMVVTRVPPPYKGMMRAVYPGFLQLSGFVSMNLGRHFRAHMDMFQNLVKGDGESAGTSKRFYKEYLTVMDMPAEFYLETLRAVFVEYDLPLGQFRYRDRLVEPEAIFRTALMTVEGAEDDICGAGQTQAAHELCSGVPSENRIDYVQQGVGHYGVFNGRKFREQIVPRISEFIQKNS